MPRNLARLRYRLPPKPVSFVGAANGRPELLERRAAQYVVRQSNPRHVKLQTVVNVKAKPLPTGQYGVRPIKPYTLRDVVDPDGAAAHGQIIYVFRSVRTNQVLYSLQELLDDHHLAQLPFIGKHSVPAALRPDEWQPHCVLTFPTAAQGHNAFRKLREFRKLHETSWDKTNPGWTQLKVSLRIRKIMDQRANTTADIAEVLRLQEAHGAVMAAALAEQEKHAAACIDKKWADIAAIAAANTTYSHATATSNANWLEHEIRRLDQKVKMKHMQKDADQKSLAATRASHEARLKRVQHALRKTAQLKKAEQDLTALAAPANEPGAEDRLTALRDETAALRARLATPDPTRSRTALEATTADLATATAALESLEAAFAARDQLSTRSHPIARSVLPPALKTPLPTPYSLDGVSVRWADMQDALFAAGSWPDAIAHEELGVNKNRFATAYLSAEEFEVEKQAEVGRIVGVLRPGSVEEGEGLEEVQHVAEGMGREEEKTGVLGMLGRVNPFKSARA
ncbi:transcriptional regulation of mitochondrial recombination-domain-containing protein [Boeremia exigua]|uniref:transcriptional regulation of mitochondrial recombination-domain-containing protein n=1 Tax=Boeremia exigua TaxID=749465 RepID=UPI001E8E05DD|nr:transcriptional regulation of mitochondrial recombination-domain-containing protein [Boeremia exigua]KAH6625516.1 transcriptional regulation of mitochondrial recombination-domain-containing protein [Boeremia exigua]